MQKAEKPALDNLRHPVIEQAARASVRGVLRRAMGSRKVEEMVKQRFVVFAEGAERTQSTPKLAMKIFDCWLI